MGDRTTVSLQRQRETKSSLGDHRHSYNAYISTYKKDFSGEMAPPAAGLRPRSFVFPSSKGAKIGIATYQDEFSAKPLVKAVPIRTGSSSGSRRNNPHPLQPFLTWRFSSDGFDKMKEWYKRPLDRQKLDNVFVNQLKSTYQVDYMGLQKGVQIKTCHGVNWKPRESRNPQYSFTSTRHAFRPPRLWPELSPKETRRYCTCNL